MCFLYFCTKKSIISSQVGCANSSTYCCLQLLCFLKWRIPWMCPLTVLCDIITHSCTTRASILLSSTQVRDPQEPSFAGISTFLWEGQRIVETGEKPGSSAVLFWQDIPTSTCLSPLTIHPCPGVLMLVWCPEYMIPPQTVKRQSGTRLYVSCCLKEWKTRVGSWMLCCSSHKWIVTQVRLAGCKLEQD